LETGRLYKTYLGVLLAAWVYPDREMWYSDYCGYVTREEFMYLEFRWRLFGRYPKLYPGCAYRTSDGLRDL
jgi:hypothetical protein